MKHDNENMIVSSLYSVKCHGANVLFLLCSQNVLKFSSTLNTYLSKLFSSAQHICSQVHILALLGAHHKAECKRCVRALLKSCLLPDIKIHKHSLPELPNSFTNISTYCYTPYFYTLKVTALICLKITTDLVSY